MVEGQFLRQARRGIAAAIPRLLVASGCGSDVVVGAEDVNSVIQESKSQERARVAEIDGLAIDCMARNGFDYAGPKRESETIEVAPGLEGEERIAAVGSGVVATELWMLDHGSELLGAADGVPPDAQQELEFPEDVTFRETLRETVNVDGEVINGGCTRWADDEYLRLHPERLTRIELSDAYGSYMQVAFEDIRMNRVNDAWSACMAAEGFTGYHKIGDQFDDLLRRIAEIQGREHGPNVVRAELEELMSYDIAVSTAAYTCWGQVESDRQELLDEYATTFADTHRDEIALLKGDG